MDKLKVLDLFSGIGGFSLGLERAGMETVAFCEIEEYPRKVLKKHWPDVPVYNDVRELTKEVLEHDGIRTIDVICGGFPCQPFSTAGNQAAEKDDRYLWPEMLRIIAEIRPTWVIGENVVGIINLALDNIIASLESIGYSVRAFIIPASGVNAPHKRDRVWIVAHANCESESDQPFNVETRLRIFPDTDCERRCSRNTEWQHAADVRELHRSSWRNSTGMGNWDTEPDVGRVANGIPNRMDRLKGLGNAVVPQIPEIIGRAILNIYQQSE